MKEETLFTANEASKILSVSEGTIRSWIQKCHLPIVRLGRAVRIKKSVLERVRDEGLESVSKMTPSSNE